MNFTVTGYRASSPCEYYFFNTDEISLPVEVDIVEGKVIVREPTGRLQDAILTRDQSGYWNPPVFFYLQINDTEELVLCNAVLQNTTIDNIPEESTNPIVCHLEKAWVMIDNATAIRYTEWRDRQCQDIS
jgi:hypothetical protein